MTNNQFKPVEKTYIIQEQPVKQSNLSTVAKNKIVNHNKPYQSQNQDSYGPCIPFNQNCECAAEQLKRQVQRLEDDLQNEKENNQFLREAFQRRGQRQQENITVNEQNNNQQNEELQRLRNEFANLQVNHNNSQEQVNILIQERNNAQQERNNLQGRLDETNNILNNLEQQVTNLTNELDRRANLSVEDYNQLLANHNEIVNERDNLRQNANAYNNLENQKITELIMNLD